MSVLNESPEVKAAREALAAFQENGQRILQRRLSGELKGAPLNRFLPDGAAHLRAVLAALDEAMETLANERGEGEGPTPEWRYDDGLLRWSLPLCDYRVTFREHGRWDIERLDGRYWDEDPCRVIDNRPTAREAMREAMRLDALRSAP